MTVENVADQAANDTVLPTATEAAANTSQDLGADQEADEGDTGAAPIDDDVEVDYEGQKFKVPPSIKDALLRQSDYTKKTQEIAEARKALEAEREAVKGHGTTATAARAEAVKLAAIEEQIEPYKNTDWLTEYRNAAANGTLDNYHQHKALFDQLMLKRETATRSLSEKEGQLRDQANREYGQRVATAQAELPKLIKGWSPELDVKLAQYGTAEGLSAQEITQATIQNPNFAKLLHKALLFDEAEKKTKTQQTFDNTQKAQPVTRVGGAGGTATQRKTTDSSGDSLSTEEWIRRENERVAKQRQAMGRR